MNVRIIIAALAFHFIFGQSFFAQRGVENIRVRNENGQVQEVKLYESSYALVIGASSYNNGWQKLPGVREDVAAVSQILTKHGFSVETAIDPTSENLLTIINRFVTQHGFTENNRLLIYFAGHGYTETGGDGRKFGYIVPVDAPDPTKNLIEFQQKAVTADEIQTVARRIRSKHALFVFDSCFSGLFISRSKAVVPKFIDYLAIQSVRHFITAGADNQEVPDESVFRQMFVRGLEGDADTNKDSYITGMELSLYLQEKVIYYRGALQTPQYGKIRDPQLDRGDFIFITPSSTESNNPSSGNRAKAATLANQALIEMMRANFNEAKRLANQALSLDDSSALAYGVRNSGYNKDLVAYRTDLEKAIRLDSNNPLFYTFLANVYRELNDAESARRNAGVALQKLDNPKNSIEFYAKAVSLFILDQTDKAIKECTKAIELDPKFALAYNDRAYLYYNKKEYRLAIQDSAKAIELNPKFALAYSNRAGYYKNEEEYDLAILDYSESIELDPKFAVAYNGRGVLYDYKQQYDSAIRDFTKAIELNPNLAQAYYNRGVSHNKKREFDLAARDFTKAIEIDSNMTNAYVNRGFFYRNEQQYDLAIRDFTKAIELDPNRAIYYLLRGSSYESRKEYNLAIRDYTKFIESNPELPNGYKNRADVYDAIGEKAKAEADRRKYRELGGN